jgi:hypothetical protein
MSSLVGFVFKIIGLSMILLVLLMTTITVVDTLTTTSRIMAMSELVQQEVARNNGLSNEAHTMFNTLLDGIVGLSTSFVMSEIVDFDNNVNGTVLRAPRIAASPGTPERPIQWGNTWGNYGEILQFAIRADYDLFGWFIGNRNAATGQVTVGITPEPAVTNTLVWNFSVPCLRYMKLDN